MIHHEKLGIEKIFLILSLLFGTVFSVVFPVFYEGDAQYHFDSATYQTNVVVDRSKIGSTASFGYGEELKAMQQGQYFEKYYKTKLPRINKEKIFDKRAKNKGITGRVRRLIPALGVYVGYHIYPSIGMMVLVARLFVTIFYSFVFYFIIKKVEYGKLVFFVTALTPVMMIQGFSLSYDSFSFILATILLACQINYFYKKTSSVIPMLFASVAVYFFAKQNMYLLLILSCLAVFDRIFNIENFEIRLKKFKIPLFIALILTILAGYYLFAHTHGGVRLFTARMFNTVFSIENQQYTRGIFLGILGNFTASYSLPGWCLYGYAIVLFILIFTEERPQLSKFVSAVGASIFFLNILGTTALYSTFQNSVSNPNDSTQIIGGQLGRYYTPLLPCLIFGSDLTSFRLILDDSWKKRLAVGWTIICSIILLMVTVYGFYIQKIPAYI